MPQKTLLMIFAPLEGGLRSVYEVDYKYICTAWIWLNFIVALYCYLYLKLEGVRILRAYHITIHSHTPETTPPSNCLFHPCNLAISTPILTKFKPLTRCLEAPLVNYFRHGHLFTCDHLLSVRSVLLSQMRVLEKLLDVRTSLA